MKSPIALLESLLDDFQRLNPGVKGLNRDIITIEKRFENEGLGFLTKALPALDEALLIGLSSGKFTCPNGFKPLKGKAIPRFLSGMLCEVFDPFTGTLKDNPDIGVLKCLHGLLRFFKKTQVSDEDVDILHQKAVNEFYQCDESASRVIIPDRHDHLIGRVCKFLLKTLNSKDLENGKYKHGPGAVKEGFRANEKFSALFDAIRSERIDIQRYGLWGVGDYDLPRPTGNVSHAGKHERHPEGCLQKNTDVVNEGHLRRSNDLGMASPGRALYFKSTFQASLLEQSPSDRASRSSAKLISVAKNSTARRTITVEPLLNQFVQQGLNTFLRESITECGILRNCLALTDQSHNQKLALEGSQYDNWATIDLKSASDLLSLRLVKSVFRHSPEFLQAMIDCRSPLVECQTKETLTLGKFAGMGNALTFPVQSICFAVICIAAILDQEGSMPTWGRLKRASRCIRVYGDDIIVRREYAHQCVNWIQDVGLTVNVKKSFLTGNFKESCGVDAFKGVDITPFYIKHCPGQTAETPSIIAGFVSLSNQLWLDGLYKASTWLREYVEASIRRRLPLVSRSSGLLGWVSRQDAMTPHKWCRNTQQFLTRSVAVVAVKRRDTLDGFPALLKCLLTSLYGNSQVQTSLFPEPMALDLDHLSSSVVRFKTRMTRRWVPTLVRDGLCAG